ncbi:MAG: glycerate kinase [Cyclobacteriaceae bacterium]|nr:glycerate kinase [Cyclobacteriaceae bacterium]
MNILIAPDKFKGSLTAKEVCDAISNGLNSKFPQAEIINLPLADGGEGTAEILTFLSKGRIVPVRVNDPLMRTIESWFGISPDGKTAFIEMATASGLQLLAAHERDCTVTTTFGTGEVIIHAMEFGAKEIILGIGGSATNDAGMGMARAMGIKALDENGKILEGRGRDLIDISSFDFSCKHPSISKTRFTVLTDVGNPLHGPDGAAHVYASQKGADEKQIRMLDDGLKNFSLVAARNGFNSDFPGAGAAGGLGAGSRFFLDAKIQNGISFISDFTQLEQKIKDADVVITGEGKVDQQTLSGKVVKGVADFCLKHNKKFIVFAGKSDLSLNELNKIGVHQLITLSGDGISESVAIAEARRILSEKASKVDL